MKVSIVVTVLNEEKTIGELLESLFSQTKKPDEIIFVDGGSNDATVAKLKAQATLKNLRLLIKPGNRAVGRNFGIRETKNEIIAITDAGCILDRNWLNEIIAPFRNPKIDIVSGYYKTQAASVFEKCVAAYTFVMPDKINPSEFFPSARSMAIRKRVWEEAGRFPEAFPFNEDYVFAQILKQMSKKFYFTQKAIVYWKPREDLKKAFLMFYYFAKGDASAQIFRPKVFLIFARYLVGVVLIVYTFKYPYLLSLISYLLSLYILWAVLKNYKYIKHWQAIFLLPLLQFTSDIAVLLGTSLGLLMKSKYEKY